MWHIDELDPKTGFSVRRLENDFDLTLTPHVVSIADIDSVANLQVAPEFPRFKLPTLLKLELSLVLHLLAFVGRIERLSDQVVDCKAAP